MTFGARHLLRVVISFSLYYQPFVGILMQFALIAAVVTFLIRRNSRQVVTPKLLITHIKSRSYPKCVVVLCIGSVETRPNGKDASGFFHSLFQYKVICPQVPIYVSSIQSLLLCLFIAAMNFVSNCSGIYKKKRNVRRYTSFGRGRLWRLFLVHYLKRYRDKRASYRFRWFLV